MATESQHDVSELRKEVACLREDMQGIKDGIQQMQQEMGSAILLLGKFMGLAWDLDGAGGPIMTELQARGLSDTIGEQVTSTEQRVHKLEHRLSALTTKQADAGEPLGASNTLHEAKVVEELALKRESLSIPKAELIDTEAVKSSEVPALENANTSRRKSSVQVDGSSTRKASLKL